MSVLVLLCTFYTTCFGPYWWPSSGDLYHKKFEGSYCICQRILTKRRNVSLAETFHFIALYGWQTSLTGDSTQILIDMSIRLDRSCTSRTQVIPYYEPCRATVRHCWSPLPGAEYCLCTGPLNLKRNIIRQIHRVAFIFFAFSNHYFRIQMTADVRELYGRHLYTK
jgi:hypothetical protein